MNAAREKVRVARSLAELPKISAAFERGEVSYSKVRSMMRVATPESENYLLNIARHGTAAHVEGLVRRFERVEALEDANTSHGNRAFNCFTDDDGSFVFHGRLTAEQGALKHRDGDCRFPGCTATRFVDGLLQASSPTRTTTARAASGTTTP